MYAWILSIVHFVYKCMCIRACSTCVRVRMYYGRSSLRTPALQHSSHNRLQTMHNRLCTLLFNRFFFFVSLLPTPCSKGKIARLAGNIHGSPRCFVSESVLASSLERDYVQDSILYKSHGVYEAFICSSLKQGRRGLPHGSCWWRSCRS